MLILLCVLYVLTYIILIIKAFIRFSDIEKCIELLHNVLKSATLIPSNYSFIEDHLKPKEDFEKHLNELLFNYPIIFKYKNSYECLLSYSMSPVEIYKSASMLYDSFLMEANFARQNIKEAFNPINSLKVMLSLPSHIIELFGFSLNISVSNVLNFLSWSIALFSSIYSEEIKAFFNKVF